MTDLFIAFMYVATMLGMCVFLGVVCRLGDLGFWILGWLDSKLQERHMMKILARKDGSYLELAGRTPEEAPGSHPGFGIRDV